MGPNRTGTSLRLYWREREIVAAKAGKCNTYYPETIRKTMSARIKLSGNYPDSFLQPQEIMTKLLSEGQDKKKLGEVFKDLLAGNWPLRKSCKNDFSDGQGKTKSQKFFILVLFLKNDTPRNHENTTVRASLED